jgi:hypothetical protein
MKGGIRGLFVLHVHVFEKRESVPLYKKLLLEKLALQGDDLTVLPIVLK